MAASYVIKVNAYFNPFGDKTGVFQANFVNTIAADA